MQTIFEYVMERWLALDEAVQDAYAGEDEIDRLVAFGNELLNANPVTGFQFSAGRQCLLLQDRTYVAVGPDTGEGSGDMESSPSFGVTKHQAGPGDKGGRLPNDPSFHV